MGYPVWFYTVFLQEVFRLYIFAENYFLIQEAPFFTFRERRETRQRMDTCFLDHVEQSSSTWVIPSDEYEIGALGIAYCVARKARIRNKPTFVDTRRTLRGMAKIFGARMHI